MGAEKLDGLSLPLLRGMIVLLFLTRPLSFLPNAVLSAIVFMIGIKLIDVKGM